MAGARAVGHRPDTNPVSALIGRTWGEAEGFPGVGGMGGSPQGLPVSCAFPIPGENPRQGGSSGRPRELAPRSEEKPFEDGLLGVEPVLGLVEDDAPRPVE